MKRVLTDIAGRLVGQRVFWHTDNQNAAQMLSIGSKEELQELVYSIFVYVQNIRLL